MLGFLLLKQLVRKEVSQGDLQAVADTFEVHDRDVALSRLHLRQVRARQVYGVRELVLRKTCVGAKLLYTESYANSDVYSFHVSLI